jgi:hypothetical protein
MSASFSIASFSAYSLARPFFSIEFAFLFLFYGQEDETASISSQELKQ